MSELAARDKNAASGNFSAATCCVSLLLKALPHSRVITYASKVRHTLERL